MSQENTNYLALDLINIKDNLNDLLEIYNFLDNLAKKLNYITIHKPVLIPYYYGKVKKDCGVSCYLFIEGGYITFHIFEKRNIAYFDIVKNGEIEDGKIIDLLTKFVESQNYNKYSKEDEAVCATRNIFGPHYFCEGNIYEGANVEDLLVLQDLIVKGIDMTPIINPVIIKDGDDLILFVVIAESHIALTLRGNYLRVDVFSCKMFDLQKLKDILTNKINIQTEKLFTRLDKLKKEQ